MAAANQTADFYPLPTGDHQYDENQRRIWQSLYYLRDRAVTSNGATPTEASSMSGTAFFAGGFTMGSGPGAKTYYNMTFKDGKLVAIS